MWRVLAVVAALTLLSATPVGAREQSQEPTVRRAIEDVLEMETDGRLSIPVVKTTLQAASLLTHSDDSESE